MDKQRHTQTKRDLPVTFKPAAEGLGFHPFADGLPYAPISQAAKSSTSPPRFAYPKTSVTLPAAHPAAQPQAQPSKVAPIGLEPVYEYGWTYVLQRFVGYALDTLLNVGVCSVGLYAVLWKQDAQPDLLWNPSFALLGGLFLLVFNWALITAQEVAVGTSIGKRLVGLRVNGGATVVFLRAFFFIPSLCFGGLGILWALWDRQHRCWHDLIVGAQPEPFARL